MDFSDNDKKEIADVIGLAENKLFDCFYLVVREKDLGKHIKDNSDLIEISGNSLCHDKTYVVWGHPLIAYISIYGMVSPDEEYRFFRIKEENIEGFEVIKLLWPDFKGKKYSFLLKDEVKDDSPEFDRRLLWKIFVNSGGDKDFYSEREICWEVNDVLKGVVLDFFTEEEVMELYKEIRNAKNYIKLRVFVLKRVYNQKFLIDIVFNKSENELVKAAAITNITDTRVLLLVFRQAGCYLKKKVFKKIIELNDRKLLDQNFLASMAFDKDMIYDEIRKEAIAMMEDIDLLKEIVWHFNEGQAPSIIISPPSLETHALCRISCLAEQNNIDEQGFFIEVALCEDLSLEVRISAIYHISCQSVLEKIMAGHFHSHLRHAAKERIGKITSTNSS